MAQSQLPSPTSLQTTNSVTIFHLHFRAYGSCCAVLRSLRFTVRRKNKKRKKKNHIKPVISFGKQLYCRCMRCALKSLPIYSSIFHLLQISPALIHNEFCCFMEMTQVGLHQDGCVCLDYLWEGANERWQGYYRGKRLWGRATLQLNTPGMPRADSDHIMQLKSKVQEVSSHEMLSL